MREWWPHHIWLKKNNLNGDRFEKHQRFKKAYKILKCEERVKDVHLSRQVTQAAKTLENQRVKDLWLHNAYIKQVEDEEFNPKMTVFTEARHNRTIKTLRNFSAPSTDFEPEKFKKVFEGYNLR